MRVTPSNGTKKRGTPVIAQHRWKRCCAWISIVTLGMFAQSGMAETTSQFVYADDEASARGVVGYVATDFGEGATETLLLGTEFSGTISATVVVGLVQMDVCVGNEHLTLRLAESGIVQFLQDGLMVAEVSPDGFGGWSHWGTEALAENKACEALLLCTRDANLQLLSSSGQLGYWRCVAKVLLCETYSLACIGTAVGSIPACYAACAGPQVLTPACIGCIIAAPGIVAATCIQAWDCWQEASRQGCTP